MPHESSHFQCPTTQLPGALTRFSPQVCSREADRGLQQAKLPQAREDSAASDFWEKSQTYFLRLTPQVVGLSCQCLELGGSEPRGLHARGHWESCSGQRPRQFLKRPCLPCQFNYQKPQSRTCYYERRLQKKTKNPKSPDPRPLAHVSHT
jgi:hypothetical protein